MSLTMFYSAAMNSLSRLATEPLAPWLAAQALAERLEAQNRIRAIKEDPDNEPWSPWAPGTERSRARKGNASRGLLYDEGLLLASVMHRSSTTGFEVGIANSVRYAPFLQNGTPYMPARPYLGWGKESLAELELSAAAYLTKLI